jgi:hypothetical protein
MLLVLIGTSKRHSGNTVTQTLLAESTYVQYIPTLISFLWNATPREELDLSGRDRGGRPRTSTKRRQIRKFHWDVCFFKTTKLLCIFSYYKKELPVTVAKRSRHVLSSLARKPGSWVRIPHKAWMFGVCMSLICIWVLCLGTGLATSWSPVQGVLPPVMWSRNWKIRGQGPKGALELVKKKSARTPKKITLFEAKFVVPHRDL